MLDLNSKSKDIYNDFSKNYDINPTIEDQDDTQFLDTLNKRIEGLNSCKTSDNDYYQKEYEKRKYTL